MSDRETRTPYLLCALMGLGGLFFGVTGPLLSNFIPPMARSVLGEERTLIGAVLALDNVIMFLLVPWAGGFSDRLRARGKGRLPIILAGLVMAAAGMAVLPSSPSLGLAGLLGAMVVLYAGINLMRAPFQALVADLVPSRFRSFATGSVTFQMCVGAIVFLMLGRLLGMGPAFLVAALSVLGIALAFLFGVREGRGPSEAAEETTFRALFGALGAVVRGTVPGLRAILVAALLLQVTFQGFASWYVLHGTERFGGRPEDMSVGFIAWAMGGVVGSLPAGFTGVRLGRRNAMLAGFALMAASFVALDRVTSAGSATVLLGLASAAWTLPAVNAYPLFIEPVAPERRGVLAALFVLCLALGGGIGDPLNGALFDLQDSYRSLFLVLAVYSATAFVAVLLVPRGAGEAGTGQNAML
ncbi:MAG: MFS transporter [Vicinamibacteria bacterium]